MGSMLALIYKLISCLFYIQDEREDTESNLPFRCYWKRDSVWYWSIRWSWIQGQIGSRLSEADGYQNKALPAGGLFFFVILSFY